MDIKRIGIFFGLKIAELMGVVLVIFLGLKLFMFFFNLTGKLALWVCDHPGSLHFVWPWFILGFLYVCNPDGFIKCCESISECFMIWCSKNWELSGKITKKMETRNNGR